jgi:DNA primase catalytic core
MGRIPDDEIERLKRGISVAELARARGVELVKKGEDLHGRCPFHDDKTPSFVVTPATNLWHCLGACQAGGSVIDFVMRSEGVSFRHAVEILRRGSGAAAMEAASTRGGLTRSQRRRLGAIAPEDAEDAVLLGRVVEHYQATLMESPEAVKYLEARGLRHPEVIERFKLGYANRTLGYRIGGKQTQEAREARPRLQRIGVMRESGHEHLAGSLVIPLFDAEGRVVQLYGRKLRDDLREGTPRHLYLPGPQRGVFNREGLASESKEAIVCEALIDALTFWCAGHRHVTSGYGVEGVTEEILDALEAADVRVVKIAFDRDEAGDRGAEKLAERLEARGMESRRVLFPKRMDANEYALKIGPAAQSLALVLEHAEKMRDGARVVSAGTSSTDVSPAPSLVADARVSAAEETKEQGSESREEPSVSSGVGPGSTRPHKVSREPGPTSPSSVRRDDDVIEITFPGRKWQIRGAGKASATELKIQARVSETRAGGGVFVDTVDLYSARQRASFSKYAAEELGADEATIRRELGGIVSEVERAEGERRAAAVVETGAPTMTEAERDEALSLLRDPKLCERILEDLERAGVVGEETNKLLSYIAATSRKLEEPLAIVIQSSSAAGKSSLMDAVLALMPEEERIQYSAMTGQSLFYMSGQTLKHKILAIAEEEGAERASYALKLLQSEGELTIASTGKDPATGRLITQTYRVEGPVMIMMTTTSPDVDEELLNRCMVLSVDERRGQTRAIHELQREGETLEGILARQERTRIRRLHRNAQRLLEPITVVNPFARELDFADHATRSRRDHMKYLRLIRAVTLLFQHQRPVKTAEHRGETLRYIEASREDVALATKLAEAVLPRSLDDLPPQTRRLLEQIGRLVKERAAMDGVRESDVRFSRREVREHTRWGQTQVRLHLERLEEHEYVITHRLGRGRLAHYQLVDEGELVDEGAPRPDEGDVRPSSSGVGGSSSGVKGASSGDHRGVIGPISGGQRGSESSAKALKKAANGAAVLNGAKHA